MSSIEVGWEICKFILPAAQTGDETALLMLCKLANPEWADVQQQDFKAESLGGGFSGNVPIKCSAAGKSGSLALKINPGSEPDGLVNAAYCQLDQAGIVPKLYCLGNPDAPGLEVYDFVQGGTASWILSKHGSEFLANEDDAASFGAIVAKLHSIPSDWYDKYKDHVKGQWEGFFVDAATDEEAAAAKASHGDYAFMQILWGNFIAKMGSNGAAICAGIKELSPLLHNLLSPDSLMGRIVVGHGDVHGCNLMHKTEGGHGDLCFIDLDFCGRFPAAIDLGTVLFMCMKGPLGFFFGGGTACTEGGYPTLEQRKRVAQAYIDALGDEAQSFTRNTVDEVVYDMEIGSALRALWMTPIMAPLNFNNAPLYIGWQSLHYSKACLNLFTQAATDNALKQTIMEGGVLSIIVDGLVAQGCTPCGMSIEQFKQHWEMFGSLGPGFTGPFSSDDAAPAEEPAAVEGLSSFQAAALKYNESTGADVGQIFNQFDLDGDGCLDVHELMGVAVACGVGFRTTAEAEAAMSTLDTDGDQKLTLEEFKGFLQSSTQG